MARKRGFLATLWRLAWVGLTVAAVRKELDKPAHRRSWHGEVAGFVPYDFRVPTLARIRHAWWDPDNEQIVMPQVFGVGWTLNLGRVVHLVRQPPPPS